MKTYNISKDFNEVHKEQDGSNWQYRDWMDQKGKEGIKIQLFDLADLEEQWCAATQHLVDYCNWLESEVKICKTKSFILDEKSCK